MRTKDRVREYRDQHPGSSLRDIQAALGISSPSVVKHHLDNDTKLDRIKDLKVRIFSMRTPFASTLSHEAALERLREINRLTYEVPE